MEFSELGLLESFEFENTIFIKLDSENAIEIESKCLRSFSKDIIVNIVRLKIKDRQLSFRELVIGEEFEHDGDSYLKINNNAALNYYTRRTIAFKGTCLVFIRL